VSGDTLLSAAICPVRSVYDSCAHCLGKFGHGVVTLYMFLKIPFYYIQSEWNQRGAPMECSGSIAKYKPCSVLYII
jgi:hypothetical protein